MDPARKNPALLAAMLLTAGLAGMAPFGAEDEPSVDPFRPRAPRPTPEAETAIRERLRAERVARKANSPTNQARLRAEERKGKT